MTSKARKKSFECACNIFDDFTRNPSGPAGINDDKPPHSTQSSSPDLTPIYHNADNFQHVASHAATSSIYEVKKEHRPNNQQESQHLASNSPPFKYDGKSNHLTRYQENHGTVITNSSSSCLLLLGNASTCTEEEDKCSLKMNRTYRDDGCSICMPVRGSILRSGKDERKDNRMMFKPILRNDKDNHSREYGNDDPRIDYADSLSLPLGLSNSPSAFSINRTSGGRSNHNVHHNGSNAQKYAEQQQQRLLLLRHASACTYEEGKCPIKEQCSSMKKVWKHIMDGCNDKKCKEKHCISSRYVLSHYRKCRNGACLICVPARDYNPTKHERQNLDEREPPESSILYPDLKHSPNTSKRPENGNGLSNKLAFYEGGGNEYYRKDKNSKSDLSQKQQLLLILHHACKCPHQEGQCPHSTLCASMKQIWKHIYMSNCRDRKCKVKNCLASRYVLSHYRKCNDAQCSICMPVRMSIRHSQKEPDKKVPLSPIPRKPRSTHPPLPPRSIPQITKFDNIMAMDDRQFNAQANNSKIDMTNQTKEFTRGCSVKGNLRSPNAEKPISITPPLPLNPHKHLKRTVTTYLDEENTPTLIPEMLLPASSPSTSPPLRMRRKITHDFMTNGNTSHDFRVRKASTTCFTKEMSQISSDEEKSPTTVLDTPLLASHLPPQKKLSINDDLAMSSNN